MHKPTLILRSAEAREIMQLLTRLASIYATLGFPEDKEMIHRLIKSLKERLGDV